MLTKTAQKKYVETIFLSVITLLFCYYLSPQDPLLVHAQFPWLWLLPVLIALRHGRLSGLLATIMIVLAAMQTVYSTLFSWDSYQIWLLGGITLTLICAEYHSFWLRRQYGLKRKEQYLDTRIKSLSNAYGILRLSHDYLEESLIIKPATLRESFMNLRQLLMKYGGKLNEEIAGQYMELLAYNADLNSAALYLCHGKQWDKNPIAFIGENVPLLLDDVLVKRCLSKRQTSYIAINLLDHNETSAYLAVIPFQAADDRLLGLLIVSEMPFLVLNKETLKKLTMLLSYIADEVWASQQAIALQKIYPDCPSMFASELIKLYHLWKIGHLDSAIVTLRLQPNPQREDIISFLIQEKRALDIIWQTTQGDEIVLTTLMPLTDQSMLLGYLQRIRRLLMQEQKLTLGESPILLQHRQISAYSNIYLLLADLLKHDNV